MLGEGVDPDGVCVVQTGRFLADFYLDLVLSIVYRVIPVNMIQAYFSKFSRAARAGGFCF